VGEAREEAVPLLPLSGGPTQAGTMQGVVFRAVIQPNGAVELGVAL